MRKIFIALAVCCISIIICSCGSVNNNKKGKKADVNRITVAGITSVRDIVFEYNNTSEDVDTVNNSSDAEDNAEVETEAANTSKAVRYSDKAVERIMSAIQMSEVIIEKEDTSADFEISGADIIYNGHTYRNLNKCLDNVNSKYSKQGLVNFFIKAFRINADANCSFCNESGPAEDLSTDEILEFSSPKEVSDTYKVIKAKYNQPVEWSIRLFIGDRVLNTYGAHDWLMCDNIRNGGQTVVLDMYNNKDEQVFAVLSDEEIEELSESEVEDTEVIEEADGVDVSIEAEAASTEVNVENADAPDELNIENTNEAVSDEE